MSDHVYKAVEITGSSPTGVDDAIRSAVNRASKTLRDLDWSSVPPRTGQDHPMEHRFAYPEVQEVRRSPSGATARNAMSGVTGQPRTSRVPGVSPKSCP
ncbi:MAG: dodecin [Solirubrobacteraceae bacterium]|jgi:flavin-binding protein dodecin|nr:dodecin [Solirubrobacteraceae bacterium]